MAEPLRQPQCTAVSRFGEDSNAAGWSEDFSSSTEDGPRRLGQALLCISSGRHARGWSDPDAIEGTQMGSRASSATLLKSSACGHSKQFLERGTKVEETRSSGWQVLLRKGSEMGWRTMAPFLTILF